MMSLALVIACGLLTGCNDDIKAERDALFVQNQELQTELAGAREALDFAESERAKLLAENDQLKQDMATVPDPSTTGFEGLPGGIEVEPGYGQITVRVPGDVLFDSGKVDIKSSAKSSLGQIANTIRSQYSGNHIRVMGYTDTDPIRKSKWTDNLELSAQRAMAVQRFLSAQGISASLMSSVANGTNNQRGSKAQSRRVEIVVVQ
ncbi:MAG: OmpA family protein [Planctomycetota bacterium]|jgi:flagellar motor protein MotB